MARIFISYRREDSDIWVGRLASELRKYLPSDQVFQDIASTDPGADFVEVLDQALLGAGVMLAVIGPRWLSATDKQGRRRLDLPGDFVRQEIAESLRRPGVRVFPLLVNGAEMPSEEELPDSLKPLHRRQAFELTVRHWDNDVAQLVQTLKKAEQEAANGGSERNGYKAASLIAFAIAIIAVVILVAFGVFSSDSPALNGEVWKITTEARCKGEWKIDTNFQCDLVCKEGAQREQDVTHKAACTNNSTGSRIRIGYLRQGSSPEQCSFEGDANLEHGTLTGTYQCQSAPGVRIWEAQRISRRLG